MSLRVVLASLLSAVLMFMWGFVYWAVLGAGAKIHDPLPADKELDVLAALRISGMTTGMYVYPFPCEMGDEAAQKETEAKAAEGPRFQLAYIKEGGPLMNPKLMGLGFAHMAQVALLTSLLTAMVLGALPTFGRRFAFVLLVATISAVWGNLGDVIWWMHPMDYAVGNIVYQIGAGALMAVAIAAVVKPSGAIAPA